MATTSQASSTKFAVADVYRRDILIILFYSNVSLWLYKPSIGNSKELNTQFGIVVRIERTQLICDEIISCVGVYKVPISLFLSFRWKVIKESDYNNKFA